VASFQSMIPIPLLPVCPKTSQSHENLRGICLCIYQTIQSHIFDEKFRKAVHLFLFPKFIIKSHLLIGNSDLEGGATEAAYLLDSKSTLSRVLLYSRSREEVQMVYQLTIRDVHLPNQVPQYELVLKSTKLYLLRTECQLCWSAHTYSD
jgi:hypothetical protein